MPYAVAARTAGCDGTPERRAHHTHASPRIDTGGTRLIGRGGDPSIPWGNDNRNKQ